MMHGTYSVKFHYRLHNTAPLVCVLSQINPVHALPSYFFEIRFNIILPYVGLPSVFFLSSSPTKTLYAFIVFLIRATCPAYLIFLWFVARIKFSKGYRSLSSSLCSFLYSAVTSSLFGPNIVFSTLLPNILSLCSSLNMTDEVSHPYKTTGKIMVDGIFVRVCLDGKRECGGSRHDNVLWPTVLICW